MCPLWKKKLFFLLLKNIILKMLISDSTTQLTRTLSRITRDIRSRQMIQRIYTKLINGPTSEFPTTLSSAFPFTIPSIPRSLFLFSQTNLSSIPMGGVLMPAGLGTGARKFHSMALTRKPGAPHDTLMADGAAASIASINMVETTQWNVLKHAGRRTPEHMHSRHQRSAKNFRFAHAATGIPKFETQIRIPPTVSREEESTSAGEDAFFHRYDALGIADGVGGWAGVKGADPSLFARRLMHHVNVEVQRYEDIDDELFAHYYEATPVDVLRRAYEITLEELASMGNIRGSSTACVVVLRGDELRVANLGDCAVTVVRQGDMVYRTEEQQHSFNFPYQLSTEQHSDSPSDAQVFRLKIQRGDIIIVGSDGVFDNLFDEDILEEVALHLPSTMRSAKEPELTYYDESSKKLTGSKIPLPQFHVDPSAISLAIARRARGVSQDTSYVESPFQMRAMQEGLYYQGGKRDDISVVVAVVTDLEDSPNRR